MMATTPSSAKPVHKENVHGEAGLFSAAKPSIDSTEALLIRRVEGGETDVFYELVRPYERALFVTALALLKNDAGAVDVAQEAVLIPLEALERKELRDALHRAMDSLPEKYRAVLFLRDVQHLSISETAEVLGLSESNVKTRLLRARLQMRDALAPGFNGAWSRG